MPRKNGVFRVKRARRRPDFGLAFVIWHLPLQQNLRALGVLDERTSWRRPKVVLRRSLARW